MTAGAQSAHRRAGYLDALSQAIHRKLQQAMANSSQRRNLLQELFADIALEVDDRAKDIIFSKDEDVISPSNNGDGLLCFYDVLADYFVRMPESTKPILDLIVQLWSQSFASHIFALLFHKWLFEVQLDNPEVLLRYSSALVQGATNVFWIDIQSNTRRFQSLFHYLLEDVALDNSRLNKIPVQAQRDMYLLLSRFILFYNSADKMESFLKQCPNFPNAIFLGGPADIFVTELTDQLQKLKVEPVLLHYLKEIKVLQGMELRLATITRLKTCLYSFTSPGGPLYPTRTVRHAAWEALDLLFSCWAIFKASNKSFLQIAISMVLALLMLELRGSLCEGSIYVFMDVHPFFLGEVRQAKSFVVYPCNQGSSQLPFFFSLLMGAGEWPGAN